MYLVSIFLQQYNPKGAGLQFPNCPPHTASVLLGVLRRMDVYLLLYFLTVLEDLFPPTAPCKFSPDIGHSRRHSSWIIDCIYFGSCCICSISTTLQWNTSWPVGTLIQLHPQTKMFLLWCFLSPLLSEGRPLFFLQWKIIMMDTSFQFGGGALRLLSMCSNLKKNQHIKQYPGITSN